MHQNINYSVFQTSNGLTTFCFQKLHSIVHFKVTWSGDMILPIFTHWKIYLWIKLNLSSPPSKIKYMVLGWHNNGWRNDTTFTSFICCNKKVITLACWMDTKAMYLTCRWMFVVSSKMIRAKILRSATSNFLRQLNNNIFTCFLVTDQVIQCAL